MTVAALLPLLAVTSLVSSETVRRSLRDEYCDQPLFITLTTDNEGIRLVDNICHTYFPLPDDPNTFQKYISRVFCDGSNDIISQIATQLDLDRSIKASPFCTYTDHCFAYAGCDTYLIRRQVNFGDCSADGYFVEDGFITGLSPNCRPIGLSCLRKVEEIIRDNGLPEQDFYVLPMKLPNRCVTQQLCLQPPNPFYNHLSGVSVGLI